MICLDILGMSGIAFYLECRLERRGWLEAEWRIQQGGREAKSYSLTKAGRQQLAAETAGWKRLSDAISLVLEAAE